MALGETKPISSIIIEMGGDEYVFTGGGGVQPGVPLPADVVDTTAIIDGAVEMEDLNDDVKDAMMTVDDRVTAEDLSNFDI